MSVLQWIVREIQPKCENKTKETRVSRQYGPQVFLMKAVVCCLERRKKKSREM